MTTAAKFLMFGIVTLIIVGVLFVYQAAFPGDFVNDDLVEIGSNYRMGDLSQLTNVAAGGVKLPARPLAYASFSLNKSLFGEKAIGFLRVNVLIHTVVALLLLRLLWLLTKFSNDDLPRSVTSVLPVGALALFWAVHPMNIQAVAYIYQRMESLMALFFLASAIQIIHYLRQPSWMRLVLATLFGLLSALSKEVAVVLPLMPFVLSACIAEPFRVRLQRARAIALPLTLTWVAIAAYVVPQLDRFRSEVLDSQSTPWSYLMTESQVIVHYLSSLVWPERLSLVYDWPTVSGFAQVALPMTCLSVALLVGLYLVWRGNLFGSGLVWFFLVLGPTSSVLPLTRAAEDYRTYLPMIGLLISVLALLLWFEAASGKIKAGLQMSFAVLVLILAVPLAIAGREQTSFYRSRPAIWAVALESQRAPFTVPLELGAMAMELKDYVQAERFARQALENTRSSSKAWGNLAMALIRQGREQEAEQVLDDGAQASEDDGSLAFARGSLWAQTDTPKAIVQFEKAVELDPLNEAAWNNLGILAARDGTNFERAQACYERSISIRGDHRQAYQNLVALHVKAEKLYDARTVLLDARRVFPNDQDFLVRSRAIEKIIREREKPLQK